MAGVEKPCAEEVIGILLNCGRKLLFFFVIESYQRTNQEEKVAYLLTL
jgi:hypothetical protein